MESMTISEVSKAFQISTRMLRYYEKIGLIKSISKDDYAYRIYDETAIRRLQYIIIFRKLHIPLKQIGVILDDKKQQDTLRILQEKIVELNDEIEACTMIRDILNVLTVSLRKSVENEIYLELIKNQDLLEVTNALLLPKSNLKEEYKMNVLNNANEKLESKGDIRILYLPPATVACSHYMGENPEENAEKALATFIKESNLTVLKPDFRIYGFNNPSPTKDMEQYGYEFYVTIPKDLIVESPLIKKEFPGGLYAAHCIKMGDFHEWMSFSEQIKASKEYEMEWREPHGMGGCMEEHINAYSLYHGDMSEFTQLDLLIPIKRK